jgi:hypothetical protein
VRSFIICISPIFIRMRWLQYRRSEKCTQKFLSENVKEETSLKSRHIMDDNIKLLHILECTLNSANCDWIHWHAEQNKDLITALYSATGIGECNITGWCSHGSLNYGPTILQRKLVFLWLCHCLLSTSTLWNYIELKWQNDEWAGRSNK